MPVTLSQQQQEEFQKFKQYLDGQGISIKDASTQLETLPAPTPKAKPKEEPKEDSKEEKGLVELLVDLVKALLKLVIAAIEKITSLIDDKKNDNMAVNNDKASMSQPLSTEKTPAEGSKKTITFDVSNRGATITTTTTNDVSLTSSGPTNK